MASKAQVKASNKYNKANTTSFTFRFNNEHDSDIIDHLQGLDNKNGFIKEVIRENIKKDQSNK